MNLEWTVAPSAPSVDRFWTSKARSRPPISRGCGKPSASPTLARKRWWSPWTPGEVRCLALAASCLLHLTNPCPAMPGELDISCDHQTHGRLGVIWMHAAESMRACMNRRPRGEGRQGRARRRARQRRAGRGRRGRQGRRRRRPGGGRHQAAQADQAARDPAGHRLRLQPQVHRPLCRALLQDLPAHA